MSRPAFLPNGRLSVFAATHRSRMFANDDELRAFFEQAETDESRRPHVDLVAVRPPGLIAAVLTEVLQALTGSATARMRIRDL